MEFLYKVVGKGTENLSGMKPGQMIEVLGPLGNGYDVKTAAKKVPVFVAGGTGIASLNFLAEKIRSKGTIFYGSRTKKELVGIDAFKKKGWEIIISTDDGTCGSKCLITDTCRKELPAMSPGKSVMFCCGPKGMIQECRKISEENRIEAYASMEEMMACGVGNCQGCVVKVNGEYKRACSDGPVFRLQDIEA